MFGLKIACWAYMVFILLGRVVNYDKTDEGSNKVRIIDNVMVIALVFIIYYLSS